MNTIVVDFEATCWEWRKHPEFKEKQEREMEIIEIGAVQVDPETFEITDEFDIFVQPVQNPKLSDFCRELTTITQDQVDDAPQYDEAMEIFIDWMGDPQEVTFASWGGDHMMFRNECQRKDVPYPPWNPWDIKDEFCRWFHLRHHLPLSWSLRFGLHKAMDMLRIKFEGTPHRGIDDARNTARVWQTIRSPENMSPRARLLFRLLQEHHPRPINRSDFRRTLKEVSREVNHLQEVYHREKENLNSLQRALHLPFVFLEEAALPWQDDLKNQFQMAEGELVHLGLAEKRPHGQGIVLADPERSN